MEDSNVYGDGGAEPVVPVQNGGGSARAPEMVNVPKGVLEQVLEGQKRLEAMIAERDAKIERLEYASDNRKTGIWDQRNKSGQLIRTMNVGVIPERLEDGSSTDRLVRGWQTVRDEVHVEDNGGVRRLVEDQVIRIFLDQGVGEDGKDKEFKAVDMQYLKFYRSLKRKSGEVIKEIRGEEGDLRAIRFPDGRVIEMDIRFVNP